MSDNSDAYAIVGLTIGSILIVASLAIAIAIIIVLLLVRRSHLQTVHRTEQSAAHVRAMKKKTTMYGRDDSGRAAQLEEGCVACVPARLCALRSHADAWTLFLPRSSLPLTNAHKCSPPISPFVSPTPSASGALNVPFRSSAVVGNASSHPDLTALQQKHANEAAALKAKHASEAMKLTKSLSKRSIDESAAAESAASISASAPPVPPTASEATAGETTDIAVTSTDQANVVPMEESAAASAVAAPEEDETTLPPGWEMHKDDSGKKFYHHEADNKTIWVSRWCSRGGATHSSLPCTRLRASYALRLSLLLPPFILSLSQRTRTGAPEQREGTADRQDASAGLGGALQRGREDFLPQRFNGHVRLCFS